MSNVSTIVLSVDKFGDALWENVAKQLQILMRAGEICVVYDDDDGIIIIQHSHRDTFDECYGTEQPIWLNEEEQEIIESYRREKNDKK